MKNLRRIFFRSTLLRIYENDCKLQTRIKEIKTAACFKWVKYWNIYIIAFLINIEGFLVNIEYIIYGQCVNDIN